MQASKPVGDHDQLIFNSPMSDQTADGLVQELAANRPQSVVDIGCGWAELLLRLLSACPDATGVGIDRDENFIERARANAEARSLSDRVVFQPELGSPIPSDLILCVGSEYIFGAVDDAATALVDWTNPGGRLLLGTLFWEETPSSQLIDDFGELPDLAGLTSTVIAAGWRLTKMSTATLADWDDFEFRYMAKWLQPTGSHDTDQQLMQTADDYLAAYLGRRKILGFAFLNLMRHG